MPELPEVEVVRLGLQQALVGRTIAEVVVAHPRAVRRHAAGTADFVAVLAGRTILAVHRRGKYLWLDLGDGMALLAHLGMSGQLLAVPANKPAETHLRIRFTFSDAGRELRFVDQRTFGGLAVVPTGAGVPEPIAHIALDVLDSGFSDPEFVAAVRRRRTGIKRALLDQTLVGGIGNIYADESLWRARLHYARPTETLTRGELCRLLDAAREVLTAALYAGGTSFDSLYVSVNGVSGRFDRSLEVYGRTGQPCSRCRTPVRRDAFMNRSSFSCPGCQPRPRRGRW
ncbi:bifunctional DNA-formamidopyrimidine glycosylase/DNA-(apurinic or apyrimidinic site) lyase [Frankia sp. CiP3]|uniref:bifunctional DNA-formamidopyrimidine glycosylase/DNA-(apurinic or apyrimidinic site) lyase n=1 Tax=Frankia sp. CiP3 TaxID=2880971 RepID=UPI001EF54CE1|nr:bifunctional DNA-formamidopyrimidine glycosylase/DNA-(apurinic or apyrimidinic site) lyase [Frankia sp. CiP3]